MSDANQSPQSPANPIPPADRPGQTIFEREVREQTEHGEDAAEPAATEAADLRDARIGAPTEAARPGGSRIPLVMVGIIIAAAVLWVIFS